MENSRVWVFFPYNPILLVIFILLAWKIISKFIGAKCLVCQRNFSVSAKNKRLEDFDKSDTEGASSPINMNIAACPRRVLIVPELGTLNHASETTKLYGTRPNYFVGVSSMARQNVKEHKVKFVEDVGMLFKPLGLGMFSSKARRIIMIICRFFLILFFWIVIVITAIISSVFRWWHFVYNILMLSRTKNILMSKVNVPLRQRYLLISQIVKSSFKSLFSELVVDVIILISIICEFLVDLFYRVYIVLYSVVRIFFGGETFDEPAASSSVTETNSFIDCRFVVFIRHGQSVWNSCFNSGFCFDAICNIFVALYNEAYTALDNIRGSTLFDSPLSKLGSAQAVRLGEKLQKLPPRLICNMIQKGCENSATVSYDVNSCCILVSNLRRTIETSELVLANYLPDSPLNCLSALQESTRNPDGISIAKVPDVGVIRESVKKYLKLDDSTVEQSSKLRTSKNYVCVDKILNERGSVELDQINGGTEGGVNTMVSRRSVRKETKRSDVDLVSTDNCEQQTRRHLEYFYDFGNVSVLSLIGRIIFKRASINASLHEFVECIFSNESLLHTDRIPASCLNEDSDKPFNNNCSYSPFFYIFGHSLWLKYFFRSYYAEDFVGKRLKLSNCGAVAFCLEKFQRTDGSFYYAVRKDSIVLLDGSFS